MRRLVLISSVVGLFFYMGVATQAGSPVSSPVDSAAVMGSGFRPLQDALSAAGVSTDQVKIRGWVETTDSDAASKLSRALGSSRGVQRLTKNGKQYLLVQWILERQEIDRWADQAAQVQSVLSGLGRSPNFSVQLMGTTEATDVEGLAETTIDALAIHNPRKWGQGAAASREGRSPKLPAGPYDVNVQVAARRGGTGGIEKTRVWVGWPALQEEF